MILITLTDCPIGLRGDLTKWLMEIQSGVFVGNVSARVRENLWERIQATCKTGRAFMVYSSNNEQKLDFLVLGNTWEPIDFDGIKLMLRPSPSRLKKHALLKQGFSKAAKYVTATRITAKRRFPRSYVAVDLETTGLDVDKDQIIQIAAVKVEDGRISDKYIAFVQPETSIPAGITEITGITNELVAKEGISLVSALTGFLEFIAGFPMVSHNSAFDESFLKAATSRCGLSPFANQCIDTLALSKRAVRGIRNYKLTTLAAHFSLPFEEPHRGENDCMLTHLLYGKLINLLETR